MVWSPADSGCLSFPRVACSHLSLNSLYWRLSLPMVKEVIWSSPPPCYWIKCNSNEPILGCYAANLGVTFSLQDKLVGAMMGIEYASVKGWTNLWLECDSQLVVTAFKNPSIVSWRLRNRWSNCLVMIKKTMNFHVSRMYREGNTCAGVPLDLHSGIYLVGYNSSFH